jgi:MYXO-CTERM domain-containing protein
MQTTPVRSWIPFLALLIATPALAQTALERLAEENGAPLSVWRPTGAERPRVVGGLGLALAGRSAAEGAAAFLATHRALLLPSDAHSRLEVTRVVTTRLGQAVHVSQRLEGLAVLNGSAVLSLDAQGRLRSLSLGLKPTGSARMERELAPAELALERAEEAFLAGGGLLRGPPRLETVWLPGPRAFTRAHLVTLPGASPPGDHTLVLVGPEAQPIFAFRRSPMAVGYAFPQNPVRGPYEQVELTNLTSATRLSGEFVEVYTCAGSSPGQCNPRQLAAPDANGDYLIAPEGTNDPNLPDDLFVEVQAYYGVNTIRDYFVSLGANPSPLKVGVNFPMRYQDGPNAYYSSREAAFGNSPAIIMGQWGTVDLAVDNDVIFHEYGHHVFGEFSQAGMFAMDEYGPVFWGLAMNEATADFFSCAALEDPILGEYFASRVPQFLPKGYLRAVENDLTCPDGLYGEGHDDGMVWSGFVWAARQLLGAAVLDPLYLDVISHFPQDIDIPTATRVFLERSALVVTAGQQAELQALAEARGLPDCQRFLAVRPEGHTGFVYGKEILGGYASMVPVVPAELHYVLAVPADATAVRLEWTASNSVADVELFVRVGQPVQHVFGMQGLSSTYDFLLEAGGLFDLAQAGVPFQAGQTYYLHPVNRGQPNTEYTLSGEAIAPEPEGGPDGGEDGGPDGGADEGDREQPDGGDAGCPPGTHPEVVDGQTLCATDCRPGYRSEFKDGVWECVGDAAACACGAASPDAALPAGLLLLAGLALLGRRRR